MNFFNTFRGRLLVILAILLIATLGLQYYLNLKTQRENNDLLNKQTQALVTGIRLGFNVLSSNDYLKDFVEREGQSFFDAKVSGRIKGIYVIDDKWRIYDSWQIDTSDPDYLPFEGENGETQYHQLSELKNLPPLMNGNRLGEDLKHFPNVAGSNETATDGEAHAIPIQTDKGRFYVMVILENDKKEAVARAARPLIYTLGILLVSSIITIFLVWQFTRPLANLSNAAQRVAAGELTFRVPGAERTDEMGKLATRFNEMTAELEKARELEAQLQQAEKSAVVGRLGSAIAHEIRNPLNYINLTLDHLRAKFAPENAEKKASFDQLTSQLKTEVARINQQISDFLNYSRPAKANLHPINVRMVVEDSLRIVEAQAADLNVKISLVEHENVPQISGDAETLRSVFNNLFINAVQSMEATGGSLNVKISPDAEFVKIEIADTGKGISEENRAKIFEPYFSTKETGTGLGLAIVHKIIDVHNGTVEVESKINEGTRFIVKLPKARN